MPVLFLSIILSGNSYSMAATNYTLNCCIKGNRLPKAELLIESVVSQVSEDKAGTMNYDKGLDMVKNYIRNGEFKNAENLLETMQKYYPDNVELLSMHARILFWQKRYDESIDRYTMALRLKDDESLKKEMENVVSARKDLFYKMNRNYLKLSGSVFDYTGDYKNERNVSIELSHKILNLTTIFKANKIYRYGLQDNQVGLDIYSKLGEKTKRWGYISFSATPDAEFLPETTLGGEIYQGYKEFEFSLGYNRMNFKASSVDIFMPGIIVYLPYSFLFTEKVYLVPKNDSYSFLSTLRYEPGSAFQVLYSIAAGKSSERIGSLEDVQKLTTISSRFGTEYRFNPYLSIGTELSYEYRQHLYKKYGATIFNKYWW